jgi:sugar phosphate isomerase/epimerase
MARLAPYIYHIHAKFYEMMDDLHEYSIPYEKVIPVLAAGGYSGYLSSEYEGAREDFQTSAQIRMQQVMLKRLLAAV